MNCAKTKISDEDDKNINEILSLYIIKKIIKVGQRSEVVSVKP